MRKRLRKKVLKGSTYQFNVLETIKRESRRKQRRQKRGYHYVIKYEMLPMGRSNYHTLYEQYFDEEKKESSYAFASHWVIALFSVQMKKNRIPRIQVFPCAADGSSPEQSPIAMIIYDDKIDKNCDELFKEAKLDYKQKVQDMKEDMFFDKL
ncbi:hypothetical protein [Alkalihalobacillus deserti]|uniref:hypothetical protein n=1 Tax=Alkalihalobacillus deserti TaxID=2879466 RepID=UPI001D15B1ED|nr:hypothetical protein [Alkalihalobacillus deserti]